MKGLGKYHNKAIKKALDRKMLSTINADLNHKRINGDKLPLPPPVEQIEVKLDPVNELSKMLPLDCWRVYFNYKNGKCWWDLNLYEFPVHSGRNTGPKRTFKGDTIQEAQSKTLEYLVSEENYRSENAPSVA